MDNDFDDSVEAPQKRVRINTSSSSGSIQRFVEPSFPMFQSREIVWKLDDYGVLNHDLKFQDIQPSYLAK